MKVAHVLKMPGSTSAVVAVASLCCRLTIPLNFTAVYGSVIMAIIIIVTVTIRIAIPGGGIFQRNTCTVHYIQ